MATAAEIMMDDADDLDPLPTQADSASTSRAPNLRLNSVPNGDSSVDEEDVEGEDEFDEEEEEFDENNLYADPENLKVEYLGKARFQVMDAVVEDRFLEPDNPESIPRMIVVDAANILHGWTPLVPGSSAQPRDQKVDAAYILSIVRFFVRKGVECMVVMQHKYMMDSSTENKFVLDVLKDLGLILVCDRTYDDRMLFAVAGEFDAVVLSEDQFREEQRDPSFMTPDARQALKNKISPRYPKEKSDFLPKCDWGKVSRNGHFVVDHLLRFQHPMDLLRRRIFVTPESAGYRFELVQEKYESWLRRKDRILSELDVLVARIQPIMEKKRETITELVPRSD